MSESVEVIKNRKNVGSVIHYNLNLLAHQLYYTRVYIEDI